MQSPGSREELSPLASYSIDNLIIDLQSISVRLCLSSGVASGKYIPRCQIIYTSKEWPGLPLSGTDIMTCGVNSGLAICSFTDLLLPLDSDKLQ